MNKRKLQNRECKKIKDKKYLLNNQNAITLIALVISIIVMLILAGVSLNATIGENGIMTQAKNATYVQSVAVLEEFMQQQYINKYEDIEQYDNKLDGFISDNELRKYFQKSITDSYYFIDSDNYKEYYFIEKSALPDEIKNQIRGGDASISGSGIYAKFNDVYGITSDLQVYYCSNGPDTRIGAIDNAKESDLSSKVVINASDNWSSELGYNRDITVEDLRTQTEIKVTNNNLDLKKLAFFGSLEKISFENVNYDNLDGIEDAPNLYYVDFSGNCNINNYQAIGKMSKLKYLYLWNSLDREVNKIFSSDNGIANFSISTLQYLAISSGTKGEICTTRTNYVGKKNENVTNIEILKDLNDVTKKAIQYISLENNSITSIEPLKDFTNVYLLKVKLNNLKSLNGIENMKNLTYLIANNNYLGTELENSNYMNIEQDSLSSISKIDTSSNDISKYIYTTNMPNLYSVDLSNNENLVWCNYLKDCKKIKELRLDGCENLNAIAVANIKSIIDGCDYSVGISSKYSLALLDDNTKYINISDLEIEKNVFLTLKQYNNVISFNMKNTKIVENNTEISAEKLNSVINEVLSNYKLATHIGLENITNLNNISFVKNTVSLSGLDLRNTGVTTDNADIGLQLLNDNVPALKVLLISNENIDLSKIQKCINKLDNSSGINSIFGQIEYGLVCYNNTTLKTLENCTEIEQLTMGYQETGAFKSNLDLDLTKCKKLKTVNFQHIYFGIVKLPENLETIIHAVQGDSKLDASLCSNLNKVSYSQNVNFEFLLNSIKGNTCISYIGVGGLDVPIFLNNIDKIKDCSNLKEIIIENVSWEKEKINVSSLSSFSKLPEIEKLKINKINVSDEDFSIIGNFTNLQELTITNTNLQDISFMSNLNKVQIAKLSNNLIVKGIDSLKNLINLEKLDLSNNVIYDISSVDGKNYRNLEILANLNYANNGSLKQLYLAGNKNITDWSQVSKCTWPNGKSGF